MRLATLPALLGTTLLLAPACLGVGDQPTGNDELGSTTQAMGNMEHSCPGPSPVMQVGDFDGSGTVDAADVSMISDFKDSGDYAAFFDMNADGALDGRDVAIVARNVGKPGTLRDAQVAAVWKTTLPYRDIRNAQAAGYIPFTPELEGHGIHFANFNLIYSWGQRGFTPGEPEGLNYTPDGRLMAVFYYEPGAIDLADYGAPLPPDTFYQLLPVNGSFDGIMPHMWHHHIGPCFGGATSPVPGFDQCMTQDQCTAVNGQLWSPGFHMIHLWLYEFNECGPFGGIDPTVAQDAPEEPHHMACDFSDVLPCVVIGFNSDGTPICQ